MKKKSDFSKFEDLMIYDGYHRAKALYEHLGWFAQFVPGDKRCPNHFNYHTRGIWETFDHPDFQICFPTPPETCHLIMQKLVDRIKSGQVFEAGEQLYYGILGNGHKLKFIKANEPEAQEGEREVLRLILPNPEHTYEGEMYAAQFRVFSHDGSPSCTCADCAKAGSTVHPCSDCGIDTTSDGVFDKNYYMVTKEIWNQYGVGEGFLCLDCLEKRLGRKFQPEDFPEVLLNIAINERVQKIKGYE